MPRVRSFAPVARADARVLILGSMPGAASLSAQRYYAHPQNAFWPIVARVLGVAADAPYAQRIARLRANGIALWDVLQSCERAGSLDADIDLASAAVNDFAAFFAAHARIEAVLCNGGTAHRLFRQRALPQLGAATRAPRLLLLPSTSPAHAGVTPSQKLAAWRAALAPFLA